MTRSSNGTLLFPGMDPRVPIPAIPEEDAWEGEVRTQLQLAWRAYGAALAAGWPAEAPVDVQVERVGAPGLIGYAFLGHQGLQAMGVAPAAAPGELGNRTVRTTLHLRVPATMGWAPMQAKLEATGLLGPVVVQADTGDPHPELVVDVAQLPIWTETQHRLALRPWLLHPEPVVRQWAVQELGALVRPAATAPAAATPRRGR